MFIENGRYGRDTCVNSMLSEFCYHRRRAHQQCIETCFTEPCHFLCQRSCCSCCGSSMSLDELWCIAKTDVEKQIDEGKLKHKHSHLPFSPTQFEPFIDIRPHCRWWFLYDSSTILRNIIIVCDRVSAYVLQHERQQPDPAINRELKDTIVSVWRQKHKQDLPLAIRDRSLAWGYVVIQNARYHTIPLLHDPHVLMHVPPRSSGILNTCASVTSSRCTSISTLVLPAPTTRLLLLESTEISPTSENAGQYP